jgi:hypothetical protein
MRKFWPRVAWTTQPASSLNTPMAGTGKWYDFNGTGTPDLTSYYVLQGSECLVFFLGGIPLLDSSTGQYGMIGFGKSPTNPFTNGIAGNAMYSNSRNPPLFEFNGSRLKALTAQDIGSLPAGYSGSPAGTNFVFAHGVPGYIDSINGLGNGLSFYAYFSNNLGLGYDPNDVNLGTDQVLNPTGTGYVLPTLAFFMQGGATASPSPNPYTTSAPFNTSATVAQTVNYSNPQSFQLISPGIDGVYGLGGAYTPNNATSPLPDESGIGNAADRSVEGDNLTNFHNGRLQ